MTQAKEVQGLTGPPTTLKKVVAAAMAGTVAEWYEFLLYSTASALVFGHLFFPKTSNPLDGVISALLIYAVGFVARPVGGLVFGHFGDKYGRKKLLQVSLLLVGVSTFLMGCIPAFDVIGYWAPITLVVLRFIQGFAVGGEWGGAVLLVGEHSPDKSRGFWSSWPQAGLPLGNLLATLVLTSLSFILSQEDFLAWGWRLAFGLSVVIIAIGYYIRTRVDDAPIFLESIKKAEELKTVQLGVFEVVRRYPRSIFIAMGARVAENIMYQLVVTFSITYLAVKVGVVIQNILLLLLIAHAVHFMVVPFYGKLSDILGRRPVFLAGSILAVGWGFVGFPMMETGDPVMIVMAITLGLLIHGLMYAPQPAMMAEMFPTRMRYSGVSFGYQVTAVFAGSLAPFISTSLLREFDTYVGVAMYLGIAAIISTVAVFFAKETKGISLRDVDATDAKRFPSDDAAVVVETRMG